MAIFTGICITVGTFMNHPEGLTLDELADILKTKFKNNEGAQEIFKLGGGEGYGDLPNLLNHLKPCLIKNGDKYHYNPNAKEYYGGWETTNFLLGANIKTLKEKYK